MSADVPDRAPRLAAARAVPVLALFALALPVGIALLVVFDPEIQRIDARELVARKDDARRFIVADYVFILIYGVLFPIAVWRFGRALAPESPPRWAKLTVVMGVAAGLVDAVEDTLLLTATGSVSEGTVDAAHALEVPKIALFVTGVTLAAVASLRALRTVREARSNDPPT